RIRQVCGSMSGSLSLSRAMRGGSGTWRCRMKRSANLRVKLGNLEGALKSHRAGFAITKHLARTEPPNMILQHDIHVGLRRIGDVQFAQHDFAGALTSYRNSLAVAERLARFDPANSRWQKDLSDCSLVVGDILRSQGDLVGALKSYRDSFVILDRLLK